MSKELKLKRPFKIKKSNSESGSKEIVLLCFDFHHQNSCYQYNDGDLTEFATANEDHYWARLGKYKDQLITVGHQHSHQKTFNKIVRNGLKVLLHKIST